MLKKIMRSFSLKLYMLATQFIANIMLARILGAHEYGKYSVLFGIVSITTIVIQFGLIQHLHREIAINHSVNKSTTSEITAAFLLSGSIFLLICMSVPLIYLVETIAPWKTVIAMLVCAYLMASSAIISAYLRGISQIFKSQVIDEIIRVTAYALFVYAFAIVSIEKNNENAILICLLAYLTSAVAGVRLIKSFKFKIAYYAMSVKMITDIGRRSLPYFLVSLTQIVFYYIDIFMINKFMAPADVGVYRISLQLVDGMNVVLVSISILISSKIAVMYNEGKYKDLGELLIKVHKAGFLVMGIAAIVVVLLKDYVVLKLLGDSYAGSEIIITTLAIGRMISSLFVFSGLALTMMGRPSELLILTLGVNLITYTLVFIFGNSLDVLGFALINVMVNIVINLIGVIRVGNLIDRRVSPVGI